MVNLLLIEQNILPFSLALITFVVALLVLNEYSKVVPAKKRRIRKRSKAVGGTLVFGSLVISLTFIVVLLLVGIFLLDVGAIIVIGNWFVYGMEPQNNFQWFLVFYPMLTFLLYVTLLWLKDQ